MLNIITSAFTDQVVAALCNTLVYSLLQGVALAAVAGTIIVLTRKASAALRYNLLVGALVLFTVGAVITFALQIGHLKNSAPQQSAVNIQPAVSDVIHVDNAAPVPAKPLTITEAISGYLNAHHNTIVLIWFLIICAKSIQLATGLQGVYRLKRTNIFEVSANWQDKVLQFANSLGIQQKIQLLESGLAKAPMVIGHLKPMILIPIGLLAALSADEVEAILMHELAHIRRRDYLVNLLQSLVEVVLFFNPAVMWVSQLIKTEREHCCDDMALAQNTGKAQYIRALVSCQEYQSTPAYAMAFPGQKNHLVDRVKRLITNRNNSLGAFEKTLLAICLVMSGLCFSAYAGKETIKKAAHTVVVAIKHQTEKEPLEKEQPQPANEKPEARTPAEALVKHEPAIISQDDTIKTPEQANKLKALSRLDNRIDTTTNQPYKSPNQGYNKNYNQNYNANLNAYQSQKDKSDRRNNEAIAEMIKDGLISTADNLRFVLNKRAFVINGKQQSDEVYQKYRDKYANTNGDGDWSWSYTNLNNNGVSTTANATTQANSTVTKPSLRAKLSPLSAKLDTIRKPLVSVRKPVNKSTSQSDEAIALMISDGLIKSRDNLSFKISNKEFILNYKKQPDDVFQKYKARYVKSTGKGDWAWMYNYDSDKNKETNTISERTQN
jgi:bla regulator protein BlaR1